MTSNLKKLALLASLLGLVPVHAQTLFQPASGDFNTATNWSNGLPDAIAAADADDHGIIPADTTATMSALYQSLTGRRIRLTVEGTLNIGSQELQLRSGSFGASSPVRGTYGDLIVNGGTVTVGSGGQIDLAGVGADLIVDAGGSVVFGPDSIASLSKAIHIYNGTVEFSANVTRPAAVEDELLVGPGSTVKFHIDNSPTGTINSTMTGSSLQLELDPESKLAVAFTNPPALGEKFTVVSGVSGYKLVGGTGTGVFGKVIGTGLTAGTALRANYLATTLEVEVIAQPPSPLLTAQPSYTLSNNGAPEIVSIPISNDAGDATTALTISGVTASGPGASMVSGIHFPSSIAADDNGFIDFTFTPGATAGTYQFDINIASNDQSAASPRVIPFTVTVAPNPILQVNASYSFTNAGLAGSYFISMTNAGTNGITPLLISDVTATGLDAATVSNIDFPEDIESGSIGDITFDFDPDLGPGTYQFNLEITSDDVSQPSPRVIAITIAVTDPAITVSTVPVNLGTLANSPGPQEIVIPIYNDGGSRDLIIDSAATTLTGNPAYTLTTLPGTIPPNGFGDLVITFNPGSNDGKFDGLLKIVSNDSAARTPQIPLTAIVSPAGLQVAVDYGTATSSVLPGYTAFTASEGATQTIGGVTLQLTSSSANLAPFSGASGDSLTIDGGATPFNGVANTYLSVKLNGLKTGTLKFLSSHNYNNINALPIDVLFGEAGGTLNLVADNITRPSTAFHTASVEAGKTYEIRILEQGNANIAYISGLLLWGDSIPDGSTSGYAEWAQSLGLSGDPAADFDKDGIADSIEFLTATDPKSANSASPMTATTAGGNIVFTFLRADAAEVPGITATVEIGTTLESWPEILHVGADTPASSPNVTVVENGSNPDTITVTHPMSGNPKLFGRLKVTVAP